MNFTFLPGSIVGFVGYPEALFVRSLASGLADAGHQVRVVEERRNELITRTLQSQGSDAYRHVYSEYPKIQFHTYEPRTGPRLLEWVSREMALSDVIVAVNGIPQELCRWIANLEQPGSIRLFLSYRSEELDDTMIHDYEIENFEGVLATDTPSGAIESMLIHPSIAREDERFASPVFLTEESGYSFVTTADAALELLDAIEFVKRRVASDIVRDQNGATPQHQAMLQSEVEPTRGV